MHWTLSHRADEPARLIADRHYSRQKPGTKGFVNPSRCIVLLSENHDAVWVTTWPFSQYVKHAWAGCWQCAMFRNEGPTLSSTLITEAIAATRALWIDNEQGMITFVNAEKIKPTNKPGWCFRKAGFKHVGETKGGLVALHMPLEKMPEPELPIFDRFKWLPIREWSH